MICLQVIESFLLTLTYLQITSSTTPTLPKTNTTNSPLSVAVPNGRTTSQGVVANVPITPAIAPTTTVGSTKSAAANTTISTTASTTTPIGPRPVLDSIYLLGCFQRKPRVIIPSYVSMNMIVPINLQRPSIEPCITACQQGNNLEFFTMAMWLPQEPKKQFWDCYCVNDFLAYHNNVNRSNCEWGLGNDTYVLAYFTCPRGYFSPPLCQPMCAVYCLEETLAVEVFTENVCFHNGSCFWGCPTDSGCTIQDQCQTLNGLDGLDVSVPPTEAYLEEVEPNLFIFYDMQIKVDGWLEKVKYSGHGHSSAYLSVWRHHSLLKKWELVGKVNLPSAPTLTNSYYVLPIADQITVQNGDLLGIHQNISVIGMYIVELQNFQTVFQWFKLDRLAQQYYSQKPGAGTFAYANLYDDNWIAGQSFPESMFNEVSDMSSGVKYFLDMEVLINCFCPTICDAQACVVNQLQTCTYGCTPGYTGSTCAPCPLGYYGEGCHNYCSGCQDDQCNRTSGVCRNGCKPDFLGPMCKIPCPVGSYGPKCTQKCYFRCANNTCTSQGCTCLPGYLAPWCNTTCPRGFWGNCSSKCGYCAGNAPCSPFDATCKACSSGYIEPYCTEACPIGLYGPNCVSTCGNCSDGWACSPITGHCDQGCIRGFQPPFCEGGCRKGYYGPDCSGYCSYCYLLNCDTQGRCNSYCEVGLKKPDCVKFCDPGTYGLGCAKKCGNCFQGNPCDPVTGNCPLPQDAAKLRCQKGYWGDLCIQICGYCWKNVACQQDDGSCPNGWCADITLPSPRCSRMGANYGECSAGFYGPACRFSCGQCLAGKPCDGASGNCTSGCETGYEPPRCDRICDGGYYGDDCQTECGQCLNREACNPFTGACVECQPGYLLPMCNSPCKNGFYGRECKFECGACMDYKACDTISGECLAGCIPGYIGLQCKFLPPNNGKRLIALSSESSPVVYISASLVYSCSVYVLVYYMNML